ncbi:MAG: PD-(D/E)XK nuclease family protein [bacterium]
MELAFNEVIRRPDIFVKSPDGDLRLEFNEQEHIYSYGGKVLPSVTTIIKEVLNIQYPDYAIYHATRGTYVHKAIELYLKNNLDFTTLDKNIKPYLDSFIKFQEKAKIVPVLLEERFADENITFAGTVDIVAEIKGKLCLFDIKTGQKHDSYKAQMAGYKKLLSDNGVHIDQIYILYLTPEGFKVLSVEKVEQYWSLFEGMLRVYYYKLNKTLIM